MVNYYGNGDKTMSIDIATVIRYIRPNSTWSLDGESYEGLTWTDPNTEKPTYDEILAAADEARLESIAKSKRKERGRLLTDTDWVVVKHNELGTPIPQEWLDYRQALRDITEQTGFPDNVEWPQEPQS